MAGHRFHAIQVVGIGIAEPLGEGEKVVVELILPRGRQSRDRASVEGVTEGNDRSAALAIPIKGVFPGQLDHGLVGFRPGVAKHHIGHSGADTQLLGHLGIRLGVKQVGDMSQLGRLGGNGLHPARIAVSQRAHTDAGGKVNILLSVHSPDSSPFSVVNGHLEAAIGVHHILLVQSLDLFKGHGVPPSIISPRNIFSARNSDTHRRGIIIFSRYPPGWHRKCAISHEIPPDGLERNRG